MVMIHLIVQYVTNIMKRIQVMMNMETISTVLSIISASPSWNATLRLNIGYIHTGVWWLLRRVWLRYLQYPIYLSTVNFTNHLWYYILLDNK